jgi:hypothetical protein
MVKQNKEKKDIKFRMRTPTGTIGVRGTEFLLAYKPERKVTLLQTLQGEVLVGPADCDFTKPNTWVKVSKGEESTVSFGGTPTPAKKFNLKKRQAELNNPDAAPEFAALANRVHGAKATKNDSFQAPEEVKKEEAEAKAAVKIESAGAKLSERQLNNKKLVEAVINKQSEQALDLLQKGADPNQVLSNESRDSLLHGAVVWNDLALIQALIDKGARVNVVNVTGNSALMELAASKEIKLETVQLLFENEINVLLVNNAKQSALDLAKANTEAENAKEVVELIAEETVKQKAKAKKK